MQFGNCNDVRFGNRKYVKLCGDASAIWESMHFDVQLERFWETGIMIFLIWESEAL